MGEGPQGPLSPTATRDARPPAPGVAGAAGRRARGAPRPTPKRDPATRWGPGRGLAATYGSGEAPAWRALRCPRPEPATETSGLKGPGAAEVGASAPDARFRSHLLLAPQTVMPSVSYN
ncbi:putative uncharacterized protein encoded by MAPKAPK5-AS1 [Pteropus medius]|uniref:putative uncharacterized protein encoded by MAPKAPK5-AS1 n=1 Tax=Pteropus vampyrus TaxID=132908 RepID=UPI00196B8259|nr:putative uncharacterized protein encoded by MAPKAPK5-AS1 [Pteropus giganteus]